ncbi:hypothetical protein FGG08_006833 [Glutinoglossum americanum]|uniref:AAA+ ATPase domain-containing protein n=1 Tax=Glutinoglossum americanum TaxID=1670608 RepID=A0A9P8KUJ8_9PEZI|nr:hypothetical protein FGG08_006833 [Glutinoglossum americanum]
MALVSNDRNGGEDRELSPGLTATKSLPGVLETQLPTMERTQSNVIPKDLTDRVQPGEEKSEAGIQPICITRVPSAQWRSVKRDAKLNPSLGVLVISFKMSTPPARPAKQNAQKGSSGQADSVDMDTDTYVPIPVPDRLAINSELLLNALGHCIGDTIPQDRNVWVRPFKYLVAFSTQIRNALQKAESSCNQAESGSGLTVQNGNNSTPTLGTEPLAPAEISTEEQSSAGTNAVPEVEVPEEVQRARRLRDELRCVVQFMDEDMRDIFDIERQIANQTLKEVTFEHLWQLYKPGDLILSENSGAGNHQYQAYRVLHVTGGRQIIDTNNKSEFHAISNRDWDWNSDSEEKVRNTVRTSSRITAFLIDCFYLDFNGQFIGPRAKRFGILAYRGKRPVCSFVAYLASLHSQYSEIYRSLVSRGKRFTELAFGAHKQYSGVTLREGLQLWARHNSSGYQIDEEEIHSEVMIDQAAAAVNLRKHHDSWSLKLGGSTLSSPTAADAREGFDPLPEKTRDAWVTDVFDDSVLDLDRRNEFMGSTELLSYLTLRDFPPLDDFKILLPPRIYGYAMHNRKWFPLDVSIIRDIPTDRGRNAAASYNDLVLPPGHKKLLQALIQNQVGPPKQKLDASAESEDSFSMDVVKGKGKGLIILLHGAPGVGKTSTAEVVAAQLKRPLLPITCGDIGTTVKEAEEKLETYCALAHRWRSVLLLDEADVFLTKRREGDLKRNALVSIFLRVLEYYPGVLILTTNRVGEFDEAFRSRIHMSLYYPKLDLNSTSEIWSRNISRIRRSNLNVDMEEKEIRKFSASYWRDNEDQPARLWNGRQIKNAFQTALALANWDFQNQKDDEPKLKRPLLCAKHFRAVAKTSALFDDYISDLHGIDFDDPYSVLAERAEVRRDAYSRKAVPKPPYQNNRSGPPRTRRAAPPNRNEKHRSTQYMDSDSQDDQDEGGHSDAGELSWGE